MTKKRRRGPKKGTHIKPTEFRVTEGRRLGLYLLPADHARLTTEADRRQISIAALARDLILAGLSDAT